MTQTHDERGLSEWLAGAMEELGWPQRKLAERAHTTPTTVSKLITGKQRLSADLAAKLADIPELKTTKEDWLISRTEDCSFKTR